MISLFSFTKNPISLFNIKASTMIYIYKDKESIVWVPHSGNIIGVADVKLHITSTIDLTTIEVPISSCELWGDFYKLTISSQSKWQEGEYEYELSSHDDIISKGVCIVQGVTDTPIEHNSEIEFLQYEE